MPGAAELGDRFGGGLTIGKVNKDRYQELIVGSPAEDDTKPRGGTGMVTQFWGGAAGPSLKKVTGVSSATATAAAKQQNTWLWYLGGSMGVTDINGDGYGEVVVGASAAQSGKNGNQGGAVVGFAGRGTGLSAKGIRVLSQDSTGIADSTEHDDRFGNSIAVGDVTGDGLGDVLVGVPGEDIGKAIDTGSIVLLRGSRKGLSGAGSQTLTPEFGHRARQVGTRRRVRLLA